MLAGCALPWQLRQGREESSRHQQIVIKQVQPQRSGVIARTQSTVRTLAHSCVRPPPMWVFFCELANRHTAAFHDMRR